MLYLSVQLFQLLIASLHFCTSNNQLICMLRPLVAVLFVAHDARSCWKSRPFDFLTIHFNAWLKISHVAQGFFPPRAFPPTALDRPAAAFPKMASSERTTGSSASWVGKVKQNQKEQKVLKHWNVLRINISGTLMSNPLKFWSHCD